MQKSIPSKLCGKSFSIVELAQIREEILKCTPPVREEIARRVCSRLDWVDSLGRKKVMSCKVALLRLDRLGLIKLPPARNGNGNGRKYHFKAPTIKTDEIELSIKDLAGLQLDMVDNKVKSELWNSLISNYHYLGYSPLAGAQKRYLIKWNDGILGAISLSASAWTIKPRDHWIGWSNKTREKNLHLVINNSRFLILPWVRVKNLASKVLSMCAKRIGPDYKKSYGYRPVLLETFVESGRFAGTSYKAANWQYIGATKGRGKLDRHKQYSLPVKDIYVYPLNKNFRSALGVG